MTTMHAIIEHNERSGRYFFSPDTMRFFKSKIEAGPYEGPGGIFFVTSEKRGFTDSRRNFGLRVYDADTGDVSTVGGYPRDRYYTRAEAIEAAKVCASNPPALDWNDCAKSHTFPLREGIDHGIYCPKCCACPACAEGRSSTH